jgi:hypothetical protein
VSHRVLRAITVLVLCAAMLAARPAVFADQLASRSLDMASSQPGAVTDYVLNFKIITPGQLGSVRAQFCSNDPLIDTACTAPAGFDVSSAVLSAQSGETGFSVDPATTANVLVLSRAPAAALAQASSYSLQGVANPSNTGSYYIRLQTYASAGAAGAATDYGGLAYSIASQISISTEVPPFLLFCTGIAIPASDCGGAAGDYINFGVPSASAPRTGQSQMIVATNAENGYVISLSGTTLTSGNNEIAAMLGAASQPGKAQFGLNLRANSQPAVGADPAGPGIGQPANTYNQPNLFSFIPNDVLASAPAASEPRKYTASYIINVPSGQPPGVYVATLTYIASGAF